MALTSCVSTNVVFFLEENNYFFVVYLKISIFARIYIHKSMKGFKIFSAIAAIISLMACSEIIGPQNPEQGECVHDWKGGECMECGERCSHNWVDGVCSICSKVCSHDWVDCVCTICGKEDHYNCEGGSLCVDCVVSIFVSTPWHLKSFCGAPVDADVYMKFNSDRSFLILQRSGSKGYTEYRGTYSLDEDNLIVSGVYSDGVNWACSYKLSINSDSELILESITENPEISVYEAAEMPGTATAQVKVCGVEVQDVRPL